MTHDEIIEMAKQAGIKRRTDEFYSEFCDGIYADDLEAFAKLVAQHTLSNIDPSKFMSYQEGMEAGRLAEREACAKVCDDLADMHAKMNQWGSHKTADTLADSIRARGQA
jgi:hypothetical protein